jgi:cytochrome P450
LSFTHQVLQEALRLYPPGWLLTRRTLEADELGGFAIAPRTDVFISPYMLHRHPDFWSDPEEFRPERFAGRCRGAPPLFLYSFRRRARGIASARTWPCSKCWCT